jgi:hypothetical protein
MKSLKKIIYFLSIVYGVIYIFFVKDLPFLKGKVSLTISLFLLFLIFLIELYTYINEKKSR